MTEHLGPMGAVLEAFAMQLRSRRAAVEPVSQIHLKLHDSDQKTAFDAAQAAILAYAARRSGSGALPKEAMQGKTFLTDEVGARRVEGVAIDEPRYWALRFDDDDRGVPGRSWVIETALAQKSDEEPVTFGIRLQCIARGHNPFYDRTAPTFARDVINACDARIDGRRVSLSPWIVDTDDEVELLVDLLRAKHRTADVVVLSLPEQSIDPSRAIISAPMISRNLAGAAHVAVITGPAAFILSDRVGREFSVFQQAVRTYRPGFEPETDDPFVHPLRLARRIADWSGGRDGFGRALVSDVLRRTVEGVDTQARIPSFAEAKRAAAELRRRRAQAAGESNDGLLMLAEAEIDQLKNDLAAEKEEGAELLLTAEQERDGAREEAQRMIGVLYHLQERISDLETIQGEAARPLIPDSLDNLETWANQNLAGSVELHNRALRGAKSSAYEDIGLIYDALLLLKEYYVPMRRLGGPDRKQAFEQRCQELGIEEQATFTGARAGEQGDAYFIKLGTRRVELDRHLKKGSSREPRYCFRLYFFWDEETAQAIVGWLPSHLTTRIS